MIEIVNNQPYPLQLVIRSKKRPRTFTCLYLPAVGDKKNIFYLEEERVTEYIHRAEKSGLITTRKANKQFGTGEK